MGKYFLIIGLISSLFFSTGLFPASFLSSKKGQQEQLPQSAIAQFAQFHGQPAPSSLIGMALGKINDDPRPDIVTLTEVRDFQDHNYYYYRIGYDISNTTSAVLNGWTLPILLLALDDKDGTIIPRDIALGNINVDPRPDLVVIAYNSSSSSFDDSRAWYHIAYDISATNSQITGGITQPIEMLGSPAWFIEGTTGLSLVNINVDPRPDMVIFASALQNREIRGYYRIAYDISATNSQITAGITQPIEMTGSWGAIEAIRDMEIGNINPDPRPDMVVLGSTTIDPEFPWDFDRYRVYYRIGYDISSTNSAILNGVTQPIEIPGSSLPMHTDLNVALGNINPDATFPEPEMFVMGRSFPSTYHYRIGYDISSTNSAILNGVTQPIEVPYIPD
jgi:hypothetical protein